MSPKEIATFYPESQQHWRAWLEKNHAEENAVWLIFYKKKANQPTLSWSEAVDEALCFGWIDSVKKTLDAERSIQFFSKRKAKSTWSKINKEKIETLTASGKMTPAGLHCVTVAQQNGSWTILDDVEALVTPPDLEARFDDNPAAKAMFLSLSKSGRKLILSKLVFAKRQETREKRLDEILLSLNPK